MAAVGAGPEWPQYCCWVAPRSPLVRAWALTWASPVAVGGGADAAAADVAAGWLADFAVVAAAVADVMAVMAL